MTTSLFLGSQEAYEQTLVASNQAMTAFAGREEEYEPVLFNSQGAVGVISVKGSLVDGRAGYMAMFGVVGYEDVREALAKAVSHQGTQAILLDVSSGGGHVAGCHELAQLVERVNAVKPVVLYAGGTCASAAYWFSASNSKSFCSATAMVGSLGVLSVHIERSRQMEEMGIKATVIRAGSEKALANPYEPLSEKAKEALTEKAAALYDVFIGHVAQAKGVTKTAADTKFGQGKEFIGAQAVAVGLIDKVGTFEDAFQAALDLGNKAAGKKTGAQARRGVGASLNSAEVLTEVPTASTSVVDNASNAQGNNMPTPLTPEQLAAMAAGVDLTAEAPTAPAASAEAPTAPAPELTAEEKSAALLADLNGQISAQATQLNALTLALASANAEVASLKTSADAAAAQSTALADIVRNSLRTMTVALGGDAKALDSLASAEAVLEKHTEVSAAFKAKFKVGGVAATTVEEPKPAASAAAKVNPMFLHAARSLNQ